MPTGAIVNELSLGTQEDEGLLQRQLQEVNGTCGRRGRRRRSLPEPARAYAPAKTSILQILTHPKSRRARSPVARRSQGKQGDAGKLSKVEWDLWI